MSGCRVKRAGSQLELAQQPAGIRGLRGLKTELAVTVGFSARGVRIGAVDRGPFHANGRICHRVRGARVASHSMEKMRAGRSGCCSASLRGVDVSRARWLRAPICTSWLRWVLHSRRGARGSLAATSRRVEVCLGEECRGIRRVRSTMAGVARFGRASMFKED
jgi:hypothetical protein